MLDDPRVRYALLVGGLVLALLAILIDPIRGLSIHFHWVQIVALIAGVVAFLAGAYLLYVRTPGA